MRLQVLPFCLRARVYFWGPFCAKCVSATARHVIETLLLLSVTPRHAGGTLGNSPVMTNGCYSDPHTGFYGIDTGRWDGFPQTHPVPLLSPEMPPVIHDILSLSVCLPLSVSLWCVSGYRKHSWKVSTVIAQYLLCMECISVERGFVPWDLLAGCEVKSCPT